MNLIFCKLRLCPVRHERVRLCPVRHERVNNNPPLVQMFFDNFYIFSCSKPDDIPLPQSIRDHYSRCPSHPEDSPTLFENFVKCQLELITVVFLLYPIIGELHNDICKKHTKWSFHKSILQSWTFMKNVKTMNIS